MARNFDVVLHDLAYADLEALRPERQEEILAELQSLRDEAVFSFGAISWRRGPSGVWKLVPGKGDFRYIAEWDPGMPDLWYMGLGRGRLTVARIKHRDYIAQLLKEAPYE